MPQPQKTRSLRRVKRKTPGGRVVIHYEKRKPGRAHCSSCGKVLHGVPRVRASYLRRFPKSQLRPERPYGGVLCSKCSRKVIIEKGIGFFLLR